MTDAPHGDTGEWPQTVRVGGREYEVHPRMTLDEYTHVCQAIQNEMEPILAVNDALGVDVSDALGTGDDDDGPR